MSFSLSERDDTIIALATPQGIGAIAVIRLSGKNAIRITNEVFFCKNLIQATYLTDKRSLILKLNFH